MRQYWLQDVIDSRSDLRPGRRLRRAGQYRSGRPRTRRRFSLTLPTDRLGSGARHPHRPGDAALVAGDRPDDPAAPRPISGLHPLDAELHFTQGLPRWKATWGFDIFNQWRQTTLSVRRDRHRQAEDLRVPLAEYKPRPDLVFRLEIDNAAARGFEHVRQIYGGPRNTSAVAITDLRNLHTGRLLHFRVLKTFG